MNFFKDLFKGFGTTDPGRKQDPTYNDAGFASQIPEGEKYLGFENPTASICYANSAVQVLYHCLPFRKAILEWKPSKELEKAQEKRWSS